MGTVGEQDLSDILAHGEYIPVDSGARWVMDRASYDRLRTATCSPEQELARASAHRRIMIEADAPPPRCPACRQGPFDGLAELTEHVVRMSDPQYREPGPGDRLYGIAVEVREDGGMPHLEKWKL
jgi:hypothetical protein